MYTVSLRIGHSQERLWHTAQWQGGQHTSIASGPVLLPSAPAAARGVLHLASAGRAARPRAARPRAARSCVATLAPLPMRSRSTPQHTHVLVLHASRPRLVGSCAAQAEGRHTLRGRQREKRAIARNAGKQVRSVAPSQQVSVAVCRARQGGSAPSSRGDPSSDSLLFCFAWCSLGHVASPSYAPSPAACEPEVGAAADACGSARALGGFGRDMRARLRGAGSGRQSEGGGRRGRRACDFNASICVAPSVIAEGEQSSHQRTNGFFEIS